MRRAKIFVHETWAGTLTEDENGYHFMAPPYRSKLIPHEMKQRNHSMIDLKVSQIEI